jgi:hypothetical protein
MKCSMCPSQAETKTDAGEHLCLPCFALVFKANHEAMTKALVVTQRERSEDLKDMAKWVELIGLLKQEGHDRTLAKELALMKECLQHGCRPRDRHRKPWVK